MAPNSRARLASSLRAIAVLAVSIVITAAVVVAMLIATLTAPALAASSGADCTRAIHPVLYTINFVDPGC